MSADQSTSWVAAAVEAIDATDLKKARAPLGCARNRRGVPLTSGQSSDAVAPTKRPTHDDAQAGEVGRWIVLVTPALLTRLASEGIADKKLSELLARDRLIPHVVHGTTYEALRDVSPLLGSRRGLSTAEDSMADVATKIAELVDVYDLFGLAVDR